jgi:hypothetical protein
MKKKVRVVTADFGNHINNFHYNLPNQNSTLYDIDYECLTDKNTPSRHNSLHPRTKGKIPKMLDWVEHDADYYIWFDSKFKVVNDNFVEEIIQDLGDFDLGLIKHPQRDSIKSELEFMEKEMINKNDYLISRYDGERMKEQVNFYLSDSNFVDNKLFGLGFFIYSKKLVENKDYNIFTDWFLHNCYWSIQDQLSLPYLLNKHKINYKIFDLKLLDNKHLKWS